MWSARSRVLDFGDGHLAVGCEEIRFGQPGDYQRLGRIQTSHRQISLACNRRSFLALGLSSLRVGIPNLVECAERLDSREIYGCSCISGIALRDLLVLVKRQGEEKSNAQP